MYHSIQVKYNPTFMTDADIEYLVDEATSCNEEMDQVRVTDGVQYDIYFECHSPRKVNVVAKENVNGFIVFIAELEM